MTYSSYLLKCCDEIEKGREYDSDGFLVALVRIQQLLGRAAELIPHGDDYASRSVNYAPIHMAIASVRRELDALVRQQPPEVECNCRFSPLAMSLSRGHPFLSSVDAWLTSPQLSCGRTTTPRYADSTSLPSSSARHRRQPFTKRATRTRAPRRCGHVLARRATSSPPTWRSHRRTWCACPSTARTFPSSS